MSILKSTDSIFSETVGPGLAVYNLSSLIYLNPGEESLSSSQIETMQDDLQHIHHNAGYMSLALQPSQSAKSVIFTKDSSNDETTVIYRISWTFHEEINRPTFESELEDKAKSISSQADNQISSFVRNIEEIERSDPTLYEPITVDEEVDLDQCSPGSKILYDVTGYIILVTCKKGL